MTGASALRLAVVEDQAFTRELTLERLQAHYGAESVTVHGYANVEDFMASDQPYDVVLLDLQLRGGGAEGPTAIRMLRERGNQVLVLSGLRSAEALAQSLAAGAAGFVSKDLAVTGDVAAAIDHVRRGDTYVQAALLDDLQSGRRPLTARQQEVLRLEALGRTIGQIAHGLDSPLTEAGVKRHLEHIKEIYPECGKQADRVRLALALGLVSPWEVYRPAREP